MELPIFDFPLIRKQGTDDNDEGMAWGMIIAKWWHLALCFFPQNLPMSLSKLFLLSPDPSQDNIHGQSVFTLKTPPKTDIFASPTNGYHFSAPIAYKCLPTRNFRKARATITIPFTLNCLPTTEVGNPTLQFDQAGLVFVFWTQNFQRRAWLIQAQVRLRTPTRNGSKQALKSGKERLWEVWL